MDPIPNDNNLRIFRQFFIFRYAAGLSFLITSTCLYCILIVVFRIYFSRNPFLIVIYYLVMLGFYYLVYKFFTNIVYNGEYNRQWYQLLDIDSIADRMSEQHNLVENDIDIKLDEQSESKSDICVICHDNIKIKEKYIKLNCGHEFCVECIGTWCMKKNNCPLCLCKLII